MPSHITHAIFCRETVKTAGLAAGNRAWFNLGCQGPDIFLHNQRRHPNTVSWGRSLHRYGFGDFTGIMEHVLYQDALDWSSPEGSYLLGFITHGILDRSTHPFVHAFSAAKEGRGKMHHPFLERLIDVEISRQRTGRHPHAMSFFDTIYLGESAPRRLVSLLARAVGRYFSGKQAQHAEERVDNAYKDTMGLLHLTDGWNEENLGYIRKNPGGKRLAALFHPPEIPMNLDVLNAARQPWPHPWDSGRVLTDSFTDLYEQALREAVSVISKITERTPDTGEETAALLGNTNLNGSMDHHRPAGLRESALPLGKALEMLYEQILNLSTVSFLVQYE